MFIQTNVLLVIKKIFKEYNLMTFKNLMAPEWPKMLVLERRPIVYTVVMLSYYILTLYFNINLCKNTSLNVAHSNQLNWKLEFKLSLLKTICIIYWQFNILKSQQNIITLIMQYNFISFLNNTSCLNSRMCNKSAYIQLQKSWLVCFSIHQDFIVS